MRLLVIVGVLLLLSPVAAASLEELFEKGSPAEIERAVSADPGLLRVKFEGGRNPMHLAARRHDAEACRVLVAHGYNIAADRGWTPLHEASLLGREQVVRYLLSNKAPVNAVEPGNGGTPLHVASFNGHLQVVKLLLQHGANVAARDKEGWTAVAQARDQGFPEIVKLLKGQGK